MNKFIFLVLMMVVLSGCGVSPKMTITPSTPTAPSSLEIPLPAPILKSSVSLEEALYKRRSIRDYSPAPLKLSEVSQLLWAAQGITSDIGQRTAPSAGALYPLQVYLVAGKVENLVAGIYEYIPQRHGLLTLSGGDMRETLASAALGQGPIKNAAIDIVISVTYERITQKYLERGIRYAQMEAGHVSQNVCLQATALDLGAVPIGAFDDNQVKAVLSMPDNENPLYIIPIGKKN